jgi:hypothetical protein
VTRGDGDHRVPSGLVASYAIVGAPVGKKLLGCTNERRVSFLRSSVSSCSFSRYDRQTGWNGKGLLAERSDAVYYPEQREKRSCRPVVGDDQMIAITPVARIADVGSGESTLTVGDLQTRDAVARQDGRIAHHEWLDKPQDRAQRGLISSTGAMRVDIEAHPGDRLTRVDRHVRSFPVPSARRERSRAEAPTRPVAMGARIAQGFLRLALEECAAERYVPFPLDADGLGGTRPGPGADPELPYATPGGALRENGVMWARIEVVLGDITDERVDAIVTAANESLMGGGGVDGAIHRAAGPRLAAAGQAMAPCDPGDAKATPAFDLDPPVKHVIHTVGPVWDGGAYGEEEVLASCYRRCLAVADELG